MNITFTHRTAFGRHFYYPSCPLSQGLSRLGRWKSLTEWQLVILRETGFKVDIVDDSTESVKKRLAEKDIKSI